jgi:hypothetical protein
MRAYNRLVSRVAGTSVSDHTRFLGDLVRRLDFRFSTASPGFLTTRYSFWSSVEYPPGVSWKQQSCAACNVCPIPTGVVSWWTGGGPGPPSKSRSRAFFFETNSFSPARHSFSPRMFSTNQGDPETFNWRPRNDPNELQCRKVLDLLWECNRPAAYFEQIYRHGKQQPCEVSFADFNFCMKLKSMPRDEARVCYFC